MVYRAFGLAASPAGNAVYVGAYGAGRVAGTVL